MVTPAPEPARIGELDALRGAALIGMMWMHVYAFALPVQSYYNPMVWGPGLGEGSQVDRVIWAVSFVFIEDKFRTLFAMLFGAGCLILIERARERDGAKPWRAHYARMAVLFVIGFAHWLLFASNDVLRAYALAGCAIPLMVGLSARALFAICVGLVTVHVAGGLNLLGSAVTDFYEGRVGSDAFLYAEGRFGMIPGSVEFALEQGREGLGERIMRSLAQFSTHMIAVAGSLPITVAAMALGMGLWKNRMLAGEWRLFLLQRCAAISAIVAIPALLGLAWWVADSGFAGPVAGMVGLVLSAPFDTLLALGYAALAMAFFKGGGGLVERLAAVGRLALTNYLAASVILAAIFASWGLGLFGFVSRAEALAVGLLPVAAMLLWSPLWLGRFGQGPVERFWRGAVKVLS